VTVGLASELAKVKAVSRVVERIKSRALQDVPDKVMSVEIVCVVPAVTAMVLVADAETERVEKVVVPEIVCVVPLAPSKVVVLLAV